MSLATISPEQAKALQDRGAVICDVRSTDDFAREHIPGAQSTPLTDLKSVPAEGVPIVFHCQAGRRTADNALRLGEASSGCEAYILGGGINAWKAAGLNVRTDRSQPIDIMRQVQIGAGSIVVVGVLLGYFVAQPWTVIALAMGAGLVFAGITGACGMAKVVALMPWNKRASA
jgi:rhodanese-related sulfurtransferase